jgi:glyoxylase-like metal-dependent hydrolase (beta-lactamase superfamily II)
MSKNEFIIEQITERACVTSLKNNLFADVNAGVIALDNFLIVVDTTLLPYHAKKFRETIENKYNLKTKFAFLTHQHGDHVFGASTFSDIDIVGSIELKWNMEKNLLTKWSDSELDVWKKEKDEYFEYKNDVKIVLPTITFDKEYKITDSNLEVFFYQSGGHTSCSGYVYFPKDRILFSGDLFFSGIFPYAGDESCNPDLWIEALERIVQFDFEFIIPGHGPVTTKLEVIKQLEFLRNLKKIIFEAVKNKIEVSEITIPKIYYTEDWVEEKTINHWVEFYRSSK